MQHEYEVWIIIRREACNPTDDGNIDDKMTTYKCMAILQYSKSCLT